MLLQMVPFEPYFLIRSSFVAAAHAKPVMISPFSGRCASVSKPWDRSVRPLPEPRHLGACENPAQFYKMVAFAHLFMRIELPLNFSCYSILSLCSETFLESPSIVARFRQFQRQSYKIFPAIRCFPQKPAWIPPFGGAKLGLFSR